MSDPTPPEAQSAASAARRATDDPYVFLIPAEALPAGFREKVAAGAFTPAPTRPAATVLLVRDGAAAPEVLLLRRHGRSGFAADAWVFPGGVVDAADRDLSIVDRLDGPTPSEWAARLGVDDPAEAVGYVVAAIREAFEETGILLARDAAGAPPAADEALEVARRALLSDVIGIREIVLNQDLRLAGDGVAYLAHWVTPQPEPRRYDTRFFLARAEPDAVCVTHEAEMTDSVWITAADAVRHFEEGGLRLLPPTIHTLRRLVDLPSADAVFARVADAPVPMILPSMQPHPDGVAIVLPDEARE
ncbi:MAG: NUDIX domain-containing protein [Gemmatimonadetes bacterium]|nr:NUDIX domain-containing protein [Gemmatimonadota bacterium]